MSRIKGLILTISIALVATGLGRIFPLVGSAVFAIVIGMIINNMIQLSNSFKPGIQYSSKKVLHYSIIVLGFTLSFHAIGTIGLKSLPILIVTLLFCGIASILLIKLLKIETSLGILIGVGTSICGGSAIAATSPVIKAKEEMIALSLSTVFLFNLVGVIVFPPLGHFFHMSQETFGFFAGTAINDTSSVVAASAVYGQQALEVATIVKLTRTLFIIPITLGLALWMAKQQTASEQSRKPWYQAIPNFILWFLVAAAISSIFNFSDNIITIFRQLAHFLITIALAGVGLTVKFRHFKQAGFKPVLFGLLLWSGLTIVSLIVLNFMLS
ncbi:MULTISPECIES: putative sulfate exporter family transporter [unclassified Staphylococcus]|uniref:YeiH family protein n=1 Tax=unclassified Staphylococcus TaxID=91994 RepID=UPI0021D00B8C|nr:MULTISPECIES: putative sulfate exporter family transporter [unclassified Staphylococcus]UXR69429.1 putative sulfate exporter family transporter [Staphylococcus sp. IVB6246]UXR71485.1 putative sulfate exporter family transporter [Staphylococcus sp. IVB6240]UXR76083.1 putative sulfate exporter family transporter [Staphylococcus sp. IVB6233]UXR80281.1 putative sulfate exporter family transporter [Staphylococcus sp. IVB6218]